MDLKNTEINNIKIAIVSPYPLPNRKHDYGSGVKSYTKNLVENLQKVSNKKLDLYVIANKENSASEYYEENGIKICRIYNRNPFYIFEIFKKIYEIKPDVVHIQHEYFLYGSMFLSAIFPFLLFFLYICRFNTIITLHGVIPLKLIDDEKFRKENDIRGLPIFLKIGLFLITKVICMFPNKIIVHEEFLKDYLIKDYNIDPKKIFVISHGVDDIKPISKSQAKRILGFEGKKVLLYFGYLTGYKGLDILLETYKKVVKSIPNSILIIAGGEHPRLRNKPWYKKWLKELRKKAKEIQENIKDFGEIIFVGYVPEEKIPLYYSAADVVVLPYKARFAASGPESLAIAYERPFLIFKSLDVKNINNDIFYFDTIEDLIKKLCIILEKGEENTKITKKIKSLKKQRIWKKIAEKHLKIYLSTLG